MRAGAAMEFGTAEGPLKDGAHLGHGGRDG